MPKLGEDYYFLITRSWQPGITNQPPYAFTCPREFAIHCLRESLRSKDAPDDGVMTVKVGVWKKKTAKSRNESFICEVEVARYKVADLRLEVA
jgi:hypothetical protein